MSNEACDQVRDHLFRLGAVGRDEGPPDCVHLDDLTTEGTRNTEYTNRFDWLGLHAEDTETPQQNVPGLQIDGYFSDEPSTTTLAPGNLFGKRDKALNSVYGHDAQFVIRLPEPQHWKGRLVIAGAPGLRGQYANDYIIADHVLQNGCAFASTDKGNSGLRFYSQDREPGDAVAEWYTRIVQLTQLVKEVAKEYYGKNARMYITGCSNAGYLTRYVLESDRADLYDGGVDWQGPLWTDPDEPTSDPEDKGPNLFTFLPQALKYYPLYPLRDARNAMIRAGFDPKQEIQWEYYYNVYWNSTEWVFGQTFDPYYAGSPADYNYAERINPEKNPWAQKIKEGVRRVSLTGDIKKPLITLHGTLDALLPITKSSDKYRKLIEEKGRSDIHYYYRIEGGSHVDGLYDYTGPDPKNPNLALRKEFREKLRPMLPCYKAAFDRLVEWVEQGALPPKNQTVRKPEEDVVNSCSELEKQK